jgi:Zn-dependent peptidase ImmA (M78 family)
MVAPVDLTAMFADLGIVYNEQPIWSGESGWIERDGDQYRVVVNSDEPEQRRRFTAAHELAHYLLHRDLMDHGSRMNRHTDRLYDLNGEAHDTVFKPHHEVQANRLAAQIVMPAPLVRQKHEQGMGSAELASEFRVSKAAMDIRLQTLGLA